MTDPSIPDALTRTLRTVLRPVVRLMLARGVTLPLAVELLKRVFVQVALEESDAGKPVTDSRVSLLTGVHRKDVKRLRNLPSAHAGLPRTVSLGAQLVSLWTRRAPWVDEHGQPRPLPRLASAGGDLSFDALVATVSKDIRARPVLDEWLRLGVARLTERDEVVLNAAAFVPQEGFEEKLSYLALHVGDHAMAAVENTLGRSDPWFERSVHYRGLSVSEVDALRARASDLGMSALQALNGEVKDDTPAADGDAVNRRFTFGVYFYADDERSEESR
ncbi:DUF6502 family protein [Methyloversatilis universalis]|uniref:DUF6502 family protein n=1 Tax=Methyloversatilis universalis TaxID=378211 RepID=UPI0004775AF7|nr:DUF6502 family protein [Methyloversatilis universalis]